MVGDTLELKDGQEGNQNTIEVATSVYSALDEGLWMYPPRCGMPGCSAKRPPEGQARGSEMWGAGRSYLKVKTAACCGPLTSPSFKSSPLASLLPSPPSQRTTKEKKAVR